MSRNRSPFNPIAALGATLCLIIPPALSFDPFTLTVFLSAGLLHSLLLGRVGVRRLFGSLGPFLAAPLGLFAVNALFSSGGDGVHRGLVVGLRSAALIQPSVAYLLAVHPFNLVRAMMQLGGLSPRLGFALFAGLNAAPLVRRDLGRTQRAGRLRLGRKSAPAARTVVTLLSGAIRHAERAALSMAARGLEEATERTYLVRTRWTMGDTLYVAAAAAAAAVLAAAVNLSGRFVFGLG